MCTHLPARAPVQRDGRRRLHHLAGALSALRALGLWSFLGAGHLLPCRLLLLFLPVLLFHVLLHWLSGASSWRVGRRRLLLLYWPLLVCCCSLLADALLCLICCRCCRRS